MLRLKEYEIEFNFRYPKNRGYTITAGSHNTSSKSIHYTLRTGFHYNRVNGLIIIDILLFDFGFTLSIDKSNK